MLRLSQPCDSGFHAKLTLWPPSLELGYQTAQPTRTGSCQRVVHGVAYGYANSIKDGFRGLMVGVYNEVQGHASGFMYGVVNNAKAGMSGLQSGVYNKARHLKGCQMAAAVNWTEQSLSGFQLGAYNFAESMSGLQVGYVTTAEIPRGIQLGGVHYNGHCAGFAVFTGGLCYQTD